MNTGGLYNATCESKSSTIHFFGCPGWGVVCVAGMIRKLQYVCVCVCVCVSVCLCDFSPLLLCLSPPLRGGGGLQYRGWRAGRKGAGGREEEGEEKQGTRGGEDREKGGRGAGE